MHPGSLAFEIRTTRADDFERDVAPLLGAHRLRVQGQAGRQAFHLRHQALPRLSISTVRYGRPVGVDVLAARAHWSISQVSAGCVTVGRGATARAFHPGAWTVYAPDCDDALAFNAQGAVQTVAVPLASMRAALAALLGHDVEHAPQLLHGAIATPGQRQRLDSIAARLWTLDGAAPGALGRVSGLQEELALYELLLTVPHQHSAALQQARPPAGSQAVRRAQAFLQAQVLPGASAKLGLHTVAAQSGLGVRALAAAFQRETGVSPMRYMRQLRLDQARLDLLSGHCNVTEAATRWGFWNLGDFARHYRQRHGELPSAAGRRRSQPQLPADPQVPDDSTA